MWQYWAVVVLLFEWGVFWVITLSAGNLSTLLFWAPLSVGEIWLGVGLGGKVGVGSLKDTGYGLWGAL